MDKNNDHEEWEARWNEDRIGFHISRPNPFLLRYWEHLEEVHPSRCFLPLCGKSVDLVWISERVESLNVLKPWPVLNWWKRQFEIFSENNRLFLKSVKPLHSRLSVMMD